MGFVLIKLCPLADPTNFTLADLHTGTGFTTGKTPSTWCSASEAEAWGVMPACTEIIVTPRREHSRKPDELYHRIERYAGGEGPFLELFARQSRPGWVTWGLEKTKFDPPGCAL